VDVIRWFLHLRAYGWACSRCHRVTREEPGETYIIEVWNGAKWFPIGTYAGFDAAIKYFIRATVTTSASYKPCGLELEPLKPLDELILKIITGEPALIDALMDVLEKGG